MSVVTERVESVFGSQPLLFTSMSWGAIFAGWFIAAAVAGLLYIAGLALGFAAFDPQHAMSAAKGIGIGGAIWIILVWAAGLFVGGLFASWFDGRADHTVGSMHGITVWGISMVTTALWLSLGLGHAMHGRGAPDARPGMAVAAASDNDALLILQANVHDMVDHGPAVHGPAGHAMDQPITAAILAGHTDTARALLLADGASQDEIDRTLPRLRTEAIAASRQIRADADRAAHYASLASWVAFLAGLFGLLGAAIGGWMGAGNVHRVYHLRRYEGRPYRGI